MFMRAESWVGSRSLASLRYSSAVAMSFFSVTSFTALCWVSQRTCMLSCYAWMSSGASQRRYRPIETAATAATMPKAITAAFPFLRPLPLPAILLATTLAALSRPLMHWRCEQAPLSHATTYTVERGSQPKPYPTRQRIWAQRRLEPISKMTRAAVLLWLAVLLASILFIFGLGLLPC